MISSRSGKSGAKGKLEELRQLLRVFHLSLPFPTNTLVIPSRMSSFTITDLLQLPNSTVRIPRLGFGVYRSPTHQCVKSCLKALEVGYRHIDTAQFYGNESEVGEALRTSDLPREQIFATTKILSPAGSVEATYDKLLESVEKIGGPGGYVDLFLIHSASSGPSGRKQLWQALERLHEEGRARSIGVSNYGIQHIEEMKAYAKVWPPHVNQIEVCFYHLGRDAA